MKKFYVHAIDDYGCTCYSSGADDDCAKHSHRYRCVCHNFQGDHEDECVEYNRVSRD